MSGAGYCSCACLPALFEFVHARPCLLSLAELAKQSRCSVFLVNHANTAIPASAIRAAVTLGMTWHNIRAAVTHGNQGSCYTWHDLALKHAISRHHFQGQGERLQCTNTQPRQGGPTQCSAARRLRAPGAPQRPRQLRQRLEAATTNAALPTAPVAEALSLLECKAPRAFEHTSPQSVPRRAGSGQSGCCAVQCTWRCSRIAGADRCRIRSTICRQLPGGIGASWNFQIPRVPGGRGRAGRKSTGLWCLAG